MLNLVLLRPILVVAAAVFALSSILQPAEAQNVGGVFGADVTPDSKALEFRVAIGPPSDDRPTRITSRLHYQQSVTDNLRLRAVVQGADTNDGDFDFDLVQFEAQYQFLENEVHGLDSAFRFDLLIGDDRANLVSFNWTSDVALNERLSVRAVVLGQVQFGSRRRDGLFLQTRSSLRYKLNRKYNLQIQAFNFYGSTDDFPSFRDQGHSIGPAISVTLDPKWSVEFSTLFGLTNATSDTDFRMFLTRSF